MITKMRIVMDDMIMMMITKTMMITIARMIMWSLIKNTTVMGMRMKMVMEMVMITMPMIL